MWAENSAPDLSVLASCTDNRSSGGVRCQRYRWSIPMNGDTWKCFSWEKHSGPLSRSELPLHKT